MREKITELEKTARLLEPQSAERKQVTNEVLNYADDFLNNIYSINAYNESEDKGIGLLDSPISDEPLNISEAIDLIRKNVDEPGLNPASGGHLGYIPGGGIYYSALGDYLADISNRYAGVFFASPGAVRMENMMIRWLSEIIGY